MGLTMHGVLKRVALGLAMVLVSPALVSYWIRARILGRDRALEGSTQALALLPGLLGQFVRRAFLMRVLAGCHHTATVEFGTIFSRADAEIGENVYIGPRCHLGLVRIERDALLAAGVHVPSGPRTHGTDPGALFREQPGERRCVRIGAGAWIGSAAVVMADVGRGTVIGAGAVVTRPVPDGVVAAGVPARIVRDVAAPAIDRQPSPAEPDLHHAPVAARTAGGG
jgi:acetyltransferase-like isoleucine patch superfamily enzyme